jgi:putative ABC transport system substrate-binding protein
MAGGDREDSMIGRRRFVATFALCFVLPGASAQSGKKVHRVGFIASSPPDGYQRFLDEFLAELKRHGYAEGKNLIVEQRWTDGAIAPLAARAEELLRAHVDVIVAWGTPATLAAKKASSQIPIVMVSIGDPVGTGIVSNLARPGGNVTGNSNVATEVSAKLLSVLKEVLPTATRIGVLRNTANPLSKLHLAETERAALALGITLYVVDSRETGEFEMAFAMMKKEGVNAVIALADPPVIRKRDQIAALALQHRIPTGFPRSENVEAGGLISYGSSNLQHFRSAAGYVHRILQGSSPADMPVEQATKLELVVNLQTAKALGVTVPRSVLVRADRVIE